MRRSELVRALARVPEFPAPRAELEQVVTPPDAAADLLGQALARADLVGRSVADLGCGMGRLAIGAALLGARPVVGIDADPRPIAAAREAAAAAHVKVAFRTAPVTEFHEAVDTIVMNPPFGAQHAHADRPFWDAALASARRAVYAFASRESRNFIERRAVERQARIEATEPVDWTLPRTFPHHRKRAVAIEVDRWILRVGAEDT